MTEETKPKPDDDGPSIAADDVGATAMAERAAEAMKKTHDQMAGSAEGVGSVGYDEMGAFEIGSDDPDETEREAPGS